MNKKLQFLFSFIAGFIVGIIILSIAGCKGISKDSAMRTSADIRADKFIFLDNESIALAESATDTGLRSEALEAYNEVNEIRAEAGLDQLTWDSNLETVASVRAKECSKKFSHTRPNGQQWYTVNSKIQGGENLAFGYNNAEDCVEAWMNSPSHKDNILYGEFEKMAISIYEDDGVYYWSNQFGYN